MAFVSINVTGDQRVKRNLRALSRRLPREAFQDGLKRVAREVERHASRTSSFRDRTGRLRRSIRVVKTNQHDLSYRVRAGGGTVDYAHFIEFGTRYIRARRFLRDAVDSVRRRARRIILRSARRNFNSAARRITT